MLKQHVEANGGQRQMNLWQFSYVEQWAIGAIDRATDRVILDMLPDGGRRNINAHTATDGFVKKTAHAHSLIATDCARYYNMGRAAVRHLQLTHAKCNHKQRQRVFPGLQTVGGGKVGTQR